VKTLQCRKKGIRRLITILRTFFGNLTSFLKQLITHSTGIDNASTITSNTSPLPKPLVDADTHISKHTSSLDTGYTPHQYLNLHKTPKYPYMLYHADAIPH
jgi:hypothetical protein